jgi:signal transduction histidine kinase
MVIRQGGSASISHDLEPTRPPARHTPIAADGAAMHLPVQVAELSHDLRVPLSSIIASLELLEDELGENPAPAVAALLDRTTKAADRMLRMLDQNLASAPATVARVRLDVDLGKVAKQLALDSARLLELAGGTLEVGHLPVVRAQPDEMYSVLQNLLTNAVKFTRPGVRPFVLISATQVPYGWRVSVTDNGIGIPTARRMDVFTLFSRVNSEGEGHGIGLGTVARTIHNFGGRVGADEAPGGGAEVWFELPAGVDA